MAKVSSPPFLPGSSFGGVFRDSDCYVITAYNLNVVARKRHTVENLQNSDANTFSGYKFDRGL